MENIRKNVIKDISGLIKDLKEQSTATIHEVMGKKGAMTSSIKPVLPGTKICGQALTVKGGPSDNLMLIKAISMAKEGQIIVLDNGNIKDSGPFGEVLAVDCMSKGVQGLITNGSVRDSKEIKKMNFPVYCTGFSIIGTTKVALGTINHPISCGNVIVNPGDIVLGDDDGVVVIPEDIAVEVLRKAKDRDEKEVKVMDELRAGSSLFDIYGYQNIMDELGCIEEK